MRDALEGGTGDGSPLSRQGPRRRLPEQEEKGEDRSGAIIIKSQFVPGLSRVFPQGPLLAQSTYRRIRHAASFYTSLHTFGQRTRPVQVNRARKGRWSVSKRPDTVSRP